jgi:hypothetical protein
LQNNLPVDGKDRDTVVVPTLVACGLIVGVLVTLFGVYAVRNKKEARNTIHRIAQDLEGRPSKAYEVSGVVRWRWRTAERIRLAERRAMATNRVRLD